ncbi:MAG: gene transfer agent family protein [Brevundimonas sp.]
MGLKTEVRVDFAGERRSFDLSPIGCVRRLQDACDAGPQFILNRLFDGSWKDHDLREPIIQGLVGAGMGQRDAQDLVEKWVDPEPKRQFIPVAQAVLMAWLVGAEDEVLEKLKAGAPKTTRSRKAKSASPASTEPASAS